MTVNVEFLEARVIELEKTIEKLQLLVNGSVNVAQISSINAKRQTEINDLTERVEKIEQMLQNMFNQY